MERDADLDDVSRVLAGNPDAFEGIVQRWQRPLINLAWRFVRDRSRAEEMAQEAFLKAFRELAGFRGDSAFSTWLFSLALNAYRSSLRRRRIELVPLDAIASLPAGNSVLEALDEAERGELVRRAVSSLPPRYRDAVTVFYFSGKSLAETARLLGAPEGTAKAWLHRGRALLRQKLERLFPAPSTEREARR